MTQDDIARDYFHILWLDNLFSGDRLFSQLDYEGFEAAGTVRVTTTKSENLEVTEGIKAQREQLESRRGLEERILKLRTKWNSALEWGKLYGSLLEDGKVMQFGWKDQNVMLFMITISNGQKTVKRLRRRPAKTVTNTRTSRAIFGDQARKELSIFEFINMYNHYMNGIDNADQLRCYYNT